MVYITWTKAVVGKSVMGLIYRDKILRPVLGKGGPAPLMSFRPAPISSPSPSAKPLAGPLGNTIGYKPLPEPWATEASFGSSSWYGHQNADGLMERQPHDSLTEHGFLCLRGFVPKSLVQPARETCREHFQKIGQSFTGGHATSDLDMFAKLPAKVWEGKPNGEAECQFTGDGKLGCQVNAQGVVTFVEPGGQAARADVQTGWRVSKIDGEQFQGHPDQPKLLQKLDAAAGRTRKPLIVHFIKWEHYSPFAITQKWTFSGNRGFLSQFGLGKCTNVPFFANVSTLLEVQLYMRPWVNLGLRWRGLFPVVLHICLGPLAP